MKTIGVSDTTHTKLKRYCENNDINQGEFVESALKYFEKNGIHPVKHENPAAEMTKIIKRLDQVVAFIRKQESEILRPMMESVNMSETRIQQDISSLVTSKEMDSLMEVFQKIMDNMDLLYKRVDGEFMKQFKQQQDQLKDQSILLKEQHTQNKEAFKLLANLMDAKNQTGIMKNLASVFDQLKSQPK